MRVFTISLLMMPINLIQCRGMVGMFNNQHVAVSSFNYSYFSKKDHNYYTFTLAIGLIILTFWHLINFYPTGNSYLTFFQTLLIFLIFQERSFFGISIGAFIYVGISKKDI